MYRDATMALPTHMLPAFLHLAVGAEGVTELRIAPDIPPKQLSGSLSWATVVPGEQPVALVDDTVMQSGRGGVLVTSHGVHLSSPRARFALGDVRWEPTYPQGRGDSASLQTAQGGLMLPRMPTTESNVALVRTLAAVAQWVRGAWQLPVGAGVVAGPVGAMAAQCLRHAELPTPSDIPRNRALLAAAQLPRLLDPASGEEPLVLLDETVGGDASTATLLTDRRIISNAATGLGDLPYAALRGVELTHGMVGSTVQLATALGPVTWRPTVPKDAVVAIGTFLHALLTLPPEQRCATPPPAPQTGDPTGARGLAAWLPFPDPRVSLLLQLVHAGHAAGALDDAVAADLVVRVKLLHQALRMGHARHGEVLVSPLPVQDLAHTVYSLFGRPMREGAQGWGHAMEFELGGGRGSAAGAVASSVVGLALLAVVGVGWVSTGGSRTQRVTVCVGGAPTGSFLAINDGPARTLAATQPKIYTALATALLSAGAEMLLRRVLFGWNAAPHELASIPDATLDHAVASRVPGLDAGVFLRRG